MLNKVELFITILCVVGIASAIYLVQERLSSTGKSQVQEVQVAQAPVAKLIMINEYQDDQIEKISLDNIIKNRNMIINDIKDGSGKDAQIGDTVVVHYVGRFQNGTEFDNSRKRGNGFEFELGAGMVIKGWDEGVVGMKVGGERVLVIPPEKAYGERGIGPIPPNATLVFTIQLLEIK